MSDDFVFPQDQIVPSSETPKWIRAGGLTKREYVATQIFAKTIGSFSEAQAAATACVKAADLLLAELEKRK